VAVVRHLVFWQGRPFLNPGLAGWFAWDLATYAAVAAFAQASLLAARRRARLAEVDALEGELSRAEGDLMEWRVRPEFLVETLDDVADAATHDAERADELTARLGDLLRSMLQHGDGARVPLAREVEMTEAFLDVHRLRAPGRLTSEMDVDPSLLEARVPGMLLLPLVEALLPPRLQPGMMLRVSVTIARRRDALLIVARRDGGRTLALELPLVLPIAAQPAREHRLVPVSA